VIPAPDASQPTVHRAARLGTGSRMDAGARVGDAQAPRTRWALLVALAGGLMMAAAFPPAGAWPLAAVGPALLTIALAGRSLRTSLAVGLVFGTAFFFPLLSWTLNVAWYAWVALAAASTVILGVLAVGQRLLLRLPGWPFAVAGWWVAAEALRDRWPWGGFPWGRIAMSQAGAATQGWAAIGGTPVLTFIIALTGAVLAWLLLTLRMQRSQNARDTLSTPDAGRATTPAGRRRVTLAGLALAGTAGLAVLPAALPLDPVPRSTSAGSAHRRGRRDPGRRSPGAHPGRAAQRLHGHRQPRSGDRQAGARREERH